MNTSTRFVTDGHLGGYIVGGDPATYYPGLWNWLVEVEGVRSVIDVGCGEGHALRFFRDKGCFALGVDGIEQDDPDIITHDYATGPLTFANPDWDRLARVDWTEEEGAPPGGGWRTREFDLAWSCEFVEHVEERYVPNFLATFRCAKLVLLTHAQPGQDGWHHVNCQTADYWRGAMAAIGYALDVEMTARARGLAAMNTDPHNHFLRSGLAFRRHE